MRVLVPIDNTSASEACASGSHAPRGRGRRRDRPRLGRRARRDAEHGTEAREALQRRPAGIRDRPFARIPAATRAELAGNPARGILDVATGQEGRWESPAREHDVAEDVTSGASLMVRVVEVRHEDSS